MYLAQTEVELYHQKWLATTQSLSEALFPGSPAFVFGLDVSTLSIMLPLAVIRSKTGHVHL